MGFPKFAGAWQHYSVAPLLLQLQLCECQHFNLPFAVLTIYFYRLRKQAIEPSLGSGPRKRPGRPKRYGLAALWTPITGAGAPAPLPFVQAEESYLFLSKIKNSTELDLALHVCPNSCARRSAEVGAGVRA
jgi:hypothetical protein